MKNLVVTFRFLQGEKRKNKQRNRHMKKCPVARYHRMRFSSSNREQSFPSSAGLFGIDFSCCSGPMKLWLVLHCWMRGRVVRITYHRYSLKRSRNSILVVCSILLWWKKLHDRWDEDHEAIDGVLSHCCRIRGVCMKLGGALLEVILNIR